MSDYILMRLLATLLESAPATHDVIAEDSSIGVKTVREGLRSLEARGLVQGRIQHFAMAGRPPIVYSLTDKGRDVAPYMVAALSRMEAACA